MTAKVMVLERAQFWENAVFRLYCDHVSDGVVTVPTYLVVEPKAVGKTLTAGVAVLPVRGERVGLLRVTRHIVGATVWEVPRGMLESGEPPLVGAVRELAEETGLAADPEQLVPLGAMVPEAGIIRCKIALFAALDCRPAGPVGVDEFGIGRLHWLTLDDALDRSDRSLIEDASTLALLYRWARAALLRAFDKRKA